MINFTLVRLLLREQRQKRNENRHRRDRKGIYILHTVRITNVSFEVQYCENKWWLPGAKIQSLITSTLRIFAPSSALVSNWSLENWHTHGCVSRCELYNALARVYLCATLPCKFAQLSNRNADVQRLENVKVIILPLCHHLVCFVQ